jgi:calcineurin-like phosphoesterase family protein
MKFLEKELIFFTSDTHFRHKKILVYQPNRKFDDIEHMNEMLIKYWNETVPPEATVIHHGDFAFASKSNIRKYRERLNGRIIITMGNHDHYSELIDIFGRENIHSAMFYNVGDQEIYSGHYPMASWKNAEEGSWNIHGHYHGHKVDDNLYKRMDVGIDTHPELRPYSFDEISAFMATRTAMPIRHPEG